MADPAMPAAEMPALPEPMWPWKSGHERPYQDAYSAGQMHAYAAAAVRAEREACAALCEQLAERHLRSGRYGSVVADHSTRAGGQVDGAEECMRAIRNRSAGGTAGGG